MNTIEVIIQNNSFEYKGTKYYCNLAVNKDTKLILQEADSSHKDEFDKLYVRESLKPNKVRLYLSEDGTPMFGMVIYTVDYKSGDNGRYACGNYYPIYEERLMPHFFQASICW